jgi:ribosomal-protein-serine acetyltransferase
MWRGTRLTDGVVELRAPRASDADEIYEAAAASLPELRRWMAWVHPTYTPTDTSEWVRRAGRAFADGQEFAFLIRDSRSDALVGTCGLNAIDRLNRGANLGYWLHSGCTGRGFATRAARLVAAFGLGELEMGRIEILAAVENQASQAVAERLGAVREGVLRRRLRIVDTVHDAVVYSLVS